MGVYLSTPNTELEAEDGRSDKLVFGAASMQGWRVGQEDAHIAIVDYDSDTSLFGVFDGHGGQEVAKYCAQHLPDFIKSLNSYKTNRLNDCLEEAFLKFDQRLTEQEVINDLKILSGSQDLENERDDTEDEINEAILLREEADIPIADLMARYNHQTPAPEPEGREPECSSSSSTKSRLSLPTHMRNEINTKDKPISPYLRAKRNANKELNHRIEETADQCTSSSATTGSSTTGPSSSMADNDGVTNSEPNSTSQPDSTNKMDSIDSEPIDELATNSEKIKETNESEVLSSVSNGELLSSNESTDCLPTSSDDLPNDENESKSKNDSISDTNEANCETSADQTSPPLPYKGKGKQKKMSQTPKIVSPSSTTDSSEETPKPIYKYFLEDFDESDDSDDDDSEDDFEGRDSSEEEEEGDDGEEDLSDEESDEDDSGVAPPPYYERPGYDSGCTAVVALLRGDQLVVANAGDSRCIVSRDGKAVEMSVDHKPEDEVERSRVEKAGGKVTPDGRVNGGLNLSRAIGDHAYKKNKRVSDRDQMITALPDIRTLELKHPNDKFMVIACDGIWNSMTSQQVIDFVAKRIERTDKLSTICDELFRVCLAPDTHGDGTGCDNMTAVIVKLVDTTAPKRKLEAENDNGVVKDSECSDSAIVSTEEPKAKRIKSDSDDTVVIETDGNV